MIKIWPDSSLLIGPGTVVTPTIDNSEGGAVSLVIGTLMVELYQGDLLVNYSGRLCPGSSPGILTVTGNYAQPYGTLEIELGGPIAGDQFDRLVVDGNLEFGGALEVVLVDGFRPSYDDRFDILDWTTRTGEFQTLLLPSLGPNCYWDTSSLYTTGELVFIPEPSALALSAIALATLAIWPIVRQRRGRVRKSSEA